MVHRLAIVGRAYEPSSGHGLEAKLVAWLRVDPVHREQATEWLQHPFPPPTDRKGMPPLEWALRDLELRKPIEGALGIEHSESRIEGTLRRTRWPRWLRFRWR